MSLPGELLRKVEVSFYCESNGKEPVRRWLRTLDKETRAIIGKDICTVQQGWPLGMPLVGILGNGLREIRSFVPNGIVRIIFTMKDNQIVLLHGFIKKSQKTPLQEIEVAKKRSKMLVKKIL